MSDSPRTDAEVLLYYGTRAPTDLIEFARELERETTALRESLDNAVAVQLRMQDQLAEAQRKLGAVLLGLECEKIAMLVLQPPETLRRVAEEVAKAAKLGAGQYGVLTDLRSRLEAAEKERDEFSREIDSLLALGTKAARERDDLRSRLEAAEKEREPDLPRSCAVPSGASRRRGQSRSGASSQRRMKTR